MKMWGALFLFCSAAAANAETINVSSGEERPSRSHIVHYVEPQEKDPPEELPEFYSIANEKDNLEGAPREPLKRPSGETSESENVKSESNDSADEPDDKKTKRKKGNIRAKPSVLGRMGATSSPGATLRMLDPKYSKVKVTYPEAEAPWWKQWWSEFTRSPSE